jgi:hypothetical protein
MVLQCVSSYIITLCFFAINKHFMKSKDYLVITKGFSCAFLNAKIVFGVIEADALYQSF